MSATPSGGRGSAAPHPMNVEQIVHEAQNFDYNPHIPLRYWFRSASTLLKEAEIYEHEGNEQQTYLLLFRHAQLVLRHLGPHPEARAPQHRAALALAEADVRRNLATLEALKPRINRSFERHRLQAAERARRLGPARARRRDPPADDDNNDAPPPEGRASPKKQKRAAPTAESPPPPPPPADDPPPPLAPGDHRDLAVRLAHRELRRRATARRATRRAGIPEAVEHERRTAGVWGDWEAALEPPPAGPADEEDNDDGDALRRQLQQVRAQVDGRGPDAAVAGSGGRPRSTYQYPRIHAPRAPANDAGDAASPARAEPPARGLVELLRAPAAPLVPPKEALAPPTPPPPPRPAKQPLAELDSPEPLSSTTSAVLSPTGSASPPPSAPPSTAPTAPSAPSDPSVHPAPFTFAASAHLESGAPLRTIFLPPDLRPAFLKLAAPNTRANLETCGVLCGTLIANALFVSKLVIPEQTSTSDTCETVNETRLFDYVDGEDLLVLGWIHTHPTQTCFMSSRDLHTHGGYQVMMPESIAIVCAPKHDQWGVFRLTDPPGMQTILNCTQTGLFHPHAADNIYTDALRPGHVFEAKGLEFEVYDMRDG